MGYTGGSGGIEIAIRSRSWPGLLGASGFTAHEFSDFGREAIPPVTSIPAERVYGGRFPGLVR